MNPQSSLDTFNKDWREDFKESFRGTRELSSFLDEKVSSTSYPLMIPRPFAEKIKSAGRNSALWNQFVPRTEESSDFGLKDPISDEKYAVGNGLIHRYKNRVLFSPTEVCPILCRYCFRKNELLLGSDTFKANLEGAKAYLENHLEVEEVILTGGDPLILSDEKLNEILAMLASVSSIKMVRFHTRTPVILPNRMTPNLLGLLNHYADHFAILSLVIHTNHLSEWSPEFLYALNILRKTKINLLSQSVLLKDVNDNAEDLIILFKSLMSNGVTPYYLHHPDDVKGAQHFRVTLEEGQRIYQDLKQNLSGFILPRYVVELPNGQGKSFAFQQRVGTEWLNKDGETFLWNDGATE